MLKRNRGVGCGPRRAVVRTALLGDPYGAKKRWAVPDVVEASDDRSLRLYRSSQRFFELSCRSTGP